MDNLASNERVSDVALDGLLHRYRHNPSSEAYAAFRELKEHRAVGALKRPTPPVVSEFWKRVSAENRDPSIEPLTSNQLAEVLTAARNLVSNLTYGGHGGVKLNGRDYPNNHDAARAVLDSLQSALDRGSGLRYVAIKPEHECKIGPADEPKARYQEGCTCTSGALQPDDACPLHGDAGPPQQPELLQMASREIDRLAQKARAAVPPSADLALLQQIHDCYFLNRSEGMLEIMGRINRHILSQPYAAIQDVNRRAEERMARVNGLLAKSKNASHCTCHPDDNPPRPCPQKYALSDCRAAVTKSAYGLETLLEPESSDPVEVLPDGSVRAAGEKMAALNGRFAGRERGDDWGELTPKLSEAVETSAREPLSAGMLECGKVLDKCDAYIGDVYHDSMCLDGWFTIEQLEAVIALMRSAPSERASND